MTLSDRKIDRLRSDHWHFNVKEQREELAVLAFARAIEAAAYERAAREMDRLRKRNERWPKNALCFDVMRCHLKKEARSARERAGGGR